MDYTIFIAKTHWIGSKHSAMHSYMIFTLYDDVARIVFIYQVMYVYI